MGIAWSRRVFAGAKRSKVSAFARAGSRGGPGCTALTRRLLGNPVPPTAEGNRPGILIFVLSGCPRMGLGAELGPLLTHLASVGLCPGPLLPQLSEEWGMCASQNPSFCSLGSQNSKSEAHGCEAVLPTQQSPQTRESRVL